MPTGKKGILMQNTKNRTSTIIILILIALMLLPMLTFGLGSASGIDTAWTVQPRFLSTNNSYQKDSVVIEKQGSAVAEIYMYIGNVHNAPNNKIKISLVHSDSKSTAEGNDSILASRKEFEIDVEQKEYLGWVKLELDRSISEKYLRFGTEQSFELFEIALLDKDGYLIPATCYGAIIYNAQNKHGFIEASKGGEFINVVDEQSAVFPKKGVNALSKDEYELAGAVNNFINFKTGYISKNANPLGVGITAIGVAMFGTSSFGVRIMGYLFMVATVYLLFFIAKKLFGTNGYAAATVILYLISGIGLSLVTKSPVTLMAIFFMMAAFNFVLSYYNKAKDGKSLRNNAHYLVLGGFMFAIAFCITPFSLFLLPALLAVVLLPSIKVIRSMRKTYNSAEGLEKEYARERYDSTVRKFALYGTFGFILLPIILVLVSYGISYPMYTAFYGKNFISAIFENHARIFSANGGSNFAGWVIGLGARSTQNAFGTYTHLFANRVFCAISFIAIITIGVLYILNAKNKIKDGRLIVALKENAGTYFALLVSFASTWILNAILWNSANYVNFAISLVFATLALVLLHKLLKNSVQKTVLNSVSIGLITIIALFFVLQTPYLFNFDLPKKFIMIYNWLV